MSPLMRGEPLPIGEWEIDRWRVKVEQGKKHLQDRKVWVASLGGNYTLLSLSTLGAITTLWYYNEEILYPSPATGGAARGGEHVLDFLRDCVELGFRESCGEYKLKKPVIRVIKEQAEGEQG